MLPAGGKTGENDAFSRTAGVGVQQAHAVGADHAHAVAAHLFDEPLSASCPPVRARIPQSRP